MRPTKPMPRKPEYFCEGCRRFHPPERVGAVRWARGGRQAFYLCQPCKERRDQRSGPRPEARHGD